MEINATIIGQFVIISCLVIGLVSYYLGRRKTQTPLLAGLLGFVLSLIPLLGIVYVIVLMLKNDVTAKELSVPASNLK